MTVTADTQSYVVDAVEVVETPARGPAGWSEFTRTWTAHAVSSVGDHFTMVALPLATYARTQSPLAVGFTAAMEGITVVLFGLLAGVMGDRMRRRRVLVVTDVLRAVVVAGLAVGLLWDAYPVAGIFVSAFLLGALRVAHDASEGALVPILVEERHLLRANSRVQASDSAATAAGPAVAGGLIALGGVPLAFAADALSFAASAAVVRSVRSIDRHDPAGDAARPPASPIRTEIAVGLRTLWADTLVMRALVLVAAMNVVAIAAEAQFIPYARDVLELNAAAIGAYFALGGAVAVATAIVTGRRDQVRGDAILLGVGVFAAGFLVAGLHPSWVTAAVAYVCAGFGSALTVTHWYALRHKRFPVHVLGRVTMVTRMAITALVPVAYIVGGWFARAYGPDALYVAVALVGIGAVTWGLLSGLARVRVD